MIRLYPRIPRAVAMAMAEERSKATTEAAKTLASTSHPSAYFATTGGVRMSEAALRDLAERVRQLATECGYPGERSSMAKDQFDARVGIILHEHGELVLSEACRDEVWNFIGCALLPDIVRWRFPGDKTSTKNFLGKDRGIDNAFGRCWWAAELLREDDAGEDSYGLLMKLGVDETVGFSRRSRAVVNRRVASALARAVVLHHERAPAIPRLELMRDAMKRFLRLSSILAFESLDDVELRKIFGGMVTESHRALSLAKGLDVEVEPDNSDVPNSTGEENASFADLLLGLQLEGRSPSRFDGPKNWMAERLGIAPEQVSVKSLVDAKNYRNRIGESLRNHPAVSLLLHRGDDEGVVLAVDSRMQLSPESVVLLCDVSRDAGVGWIVAARQMGVLFAITELFPDARVHLVEMQRDEGRELSAEVWAEVQSELADMPLGAVNATNSARDIVARILRGGGEVKVKRIMDSKNIGNRLSEGLGQGNPALIVGVLPELLENTVRIAREQLTVLTDDILVVIVAEDDGHGLVRVPVALRGGQHEDANEEDAAAEQDGRGEITGEDEEDQDQNDDDDPNESNEGARRRPESFILEEPELQARRVAHHLRFLGPLSKGEAIRAAAESMRRHGELEYQRLRGHGRVYNVVLGAIEMGVRLGLIDRPRWGEVRAILSSAESYTKADWARTVELALPDGEAIGRDELVRVVALWARENLGLEYQRLRKNGKIDRGVRNAVRTLIRRGRMVATSRDEVTLLLED